MAITKTTFIKKKTFREASFRKRKTELFKEIEELSTTTGVPACAIVYNPDGGKFETWPPTRSEVTHVIQKFENLSVMEPSLDVVDQERLVKEELERELKELRENNRRLEIEYFINQFLAGERPNKKLDPADLRDISVRISEKLEEINGRIKMLK